MKKNIIAVVLILSLIIIGYTFFLTNKTKPLVNNNKTSGVDYDKININDYEALEVVCKKKDSLEQDCCLDSVMIMKKNNLWLAPQTEKCPIGYFKDSLDCSGAFTWCSKNIN